MSSRSFELDLYANLIVFSSTEWDSLVVQPDLNLPDDGFFDSLALVAGIDAGETLAGFSVLFDWLGDEVPGSQAWNIVDPATLATLDAGLTTPRAAVPEPGTFALLALGLAGLLICRRRQLWTGRKLLKGGRMHIAAAHALVFARVLVANCSSRLRRADCR
jgi:hypothetical protein